MENYDAIRCYPKCYGVVKLKCPRDCSEFGKTG